MFTVSWIFKHKFSPHAEEQIQSRFKDEASGYILALINYFVQFGIEKSKDNELT